MPTRYIANRAFGSLRKFSAIYKHGQINDLYIEENKSPNIFWLLSNWSKDEIRSYQIEIDDSRMFLERNQLWKQIK